MVADNQKTPKTSAVVGAVKKPGLFSFVKKHILVIAAAIVLIAAAILIPYFIIHRHNMNKYATTACSSPAAGSVINDSYKALNDYNVAALSTEASKITKLQNYQEDPNCMYIITYYYVSHLNVAKSKSSLEVFNRDYKGVLSPELVKFASVNKLRTTVGNISELITQNQKNSSDTSPVPLKLNKK